jgi:hypothetical protein
MAPLLPPLLMRRAERARASPPTTTPASATRAATVPTTRPVVREYASTAADWATTGAAVGVVSPNPSSKVAASAARQVADGHEVQGLGKVPECPS